MERFKTLHFIGVMNWLSLLESSIAGNLRPFSINILGIWAWTGLDIGHCSRTVKALSVVGTHGGNWLNPKEYNSEFISCNCDL